MWIDARGSQVLERVECLRLLALPGDGTGPVGRVGFALDGVPIILPVNYGMVDGDLVVRTGEGVKLLSAIDRAIVAFEVDAVDLDKMEAWSVLVRGLCTEISDPDEVERARAATPAPLVAEPGDRYLRIRTGVLTGRRFPLATTDDTSREGSPTPA
jgi:nitroimidazol reductase NimA-like FMN-containing flavoprotein (pyridoxamine 5'-phosphate oxidase superfamily)